MPRASNEVLSTRERIRAVAVECFATKGFAGTGIRELADLVGITTAALYHHVSSKDDLLDDIVSRSMAGLLTCGRYWRDCELGSAERLAGLVGAHVVLHALAPNEVIVVDRQLAAMRDDSRRRAIEERDEYERIWQTVIEEGVANGSFSVQNPRLATLALLGSTTAVADWFRPESSMSPEQVASVFVDMSLDLLNATDRPSMPDLKPALQYFPDY